MEKADLLVLDAAEVLTLKGRKGPRFGPALSELGRIPKGAVAIRGGRIAAVGKSSELSKWKATRTIRATGKVVMPGFVDSHTHAVFAGSRERELEMKLEGWKYEDILAVGGGIHSTVEATRKASTARIVEETKARLDRMLRNGTTTAEVKTGYCLDTKGELKLLEAISRLQATHDVTIVPTLMAAHAVPPEYKGDTDKFVSMVVEETIPAAAKTSVPKFCDIFLEKGIFTPHHARSVLKAGKEHGLQAKIHADEINTFGGAELAAELSCVSADHLLKTSDRGMRALAREGVIGVLLPGTPFCSFMRSYANALDMVGKGVPLALGSDMSPNAWTESMQAVISLAVYQMRMTPAEAVVASTINAAHACGVADDVGSLEPGKRADVLVIDAPSHEWLGYRYGTNQVETVVKDGKVVVGTDG
ncbi:MAG: imidazolonepropionase [Euryarchaeota archaeon]|nr:imidazolonepropionase [Euryarchaeota archaeon]